MLKFILTAALIYFTFVLFRKKKVNDDKKQLEEAVDLAKDEICGTYIEVTTPYKVKYYEKIYHFCSKECMDKFIEEKKKREV
ncbi:YHS domain-containing protein [Deferribacter thermophilus]|uniref:YHS domain-containing protein n=1 Tax=Deferribacter thermophilus TaxID=53573 RepID=UPI003C14CC22